MQIRTLVIAAAVALAACGQGASAPEATAPNEPPEEMGLNIEVGRYGVMLSQVRTLTAERPGVTEMAPTDTRDISRRLREAVWELNLERSSLCARGLYVEATCAPAYQPVWIGEPATHAPTLEELRVRSDALGAEIMRLWNIACEEARAAEPDEQERQFICAIE